MNDKQQYATWNLGSFTQYIVKRGNKRVEVRLETIHKRFYMPCELLKFYWVVIRSNIKDRPEGTRLESRSSMSRLVVVQLRFDKGLRGSVGATLKIFPSLVAHRIMENYPCPHC